MKLHRDISKILSLNENLYIVGGYVRDYFLGLESKDVDIIYEGDISSIYKAFHEKIVSSEKGKIEKSRITEIKKYDRYLAFSFSFGNYDFTITSAREEEYVSKDGIYKLHRCVATSLLNDLKRRDFTVNAIVYDFHRDKFIDPYGGIEDINRGLLKRVALYVEDPKRVLRALILKCRYNFIFDKENEKDILNNLYLLKLIPKRHVQECLNKLKD